MKKVLAVAAVSGGLLLSAPAAFAATPAGHAGNPKAYLRVMPTAARAGAKVQIRLGCEASSTSDLASPVLKIGALRRVGPQNDPAKAPAAAASATVQAAAPGVYKVSFSCGGAELTTKFTVLGERRQVAKVPSGAPQTGGGPGDHGSLAAAGAMGVLALGGGGLVLARRSWRR
ncbi:hypothetical protein AMES_0919 [Amycolatopsis mediterranei S699]|uniref:Gram-positive cocci surface proteins LPxTG domain-containing protein n=2 Tax=Amycolatopsis mediterranei TaxID=33910 RepID=A0A0H3CZR6_AMYMU|nr:hypothetical protein [Amycolatopsis mediterranei]ADJ42741.1 conserved hypothetical protein [Amycolatopsis mediterranei U32]AEK39432.1 hypothetical protein RAM_04700 [Amycolatopsis mediterranei S699]AFO74455.1 hypothetical protein AMES_0919 [Amycolatopsis mediterranei S699]AGT81584.1 hypothetical protein B737_0920 [Amycolatopsis mediterranei RB]KDO09959.1 hypothetical protein DV26_14870 [Amycolatopsis mediterranei]